MNFQNGRPFLRPLAAAGLTFLAASAALTGASTTPPATVKTKTLEVRSEMSADSSVVKVLKKGDKVTVGIEVEENGADWCEVSEPASMTRLGYVPCQSLDRPAPPKAETAYLTGAANQGVSVLLGKAGPTRNPASHVAPTRAAPSAAADRRFVTGDVAAPDFSLTGLDGQTHSLSDYRGHYVLLDIWATWCGPCRLELPRLEELQREYASSGLDVVGVEAGDSPARVRSFISHTGVDYTVLLDPQNRISRTYDAEYIPTLVVIDPNGDVRFYDSGAYSLRDLRLILARVGLR